MEETFDVVDRSDTVIGRASREEVHRDGLLHRSAHLLVFDGSGRVLLQKRSMEKDRFPGGGTLRCPGTSIAARATTSA